MGRTRRYKKLKAIDPFSKESAAKARAGPEEVSGEVRPPSRNESSRLPRRMQELMRLKERMASGNSAGGSGKRSSGPAADKPKSERLFKHMEALPGESLPAFNRRVKAELRKRVAEIKAAAPAAEAKTISDARRAHLEARAEAKKRRKLGLPADAPLPEDAAAAAEAAQLTGSKRGRGADAARPAAGGAGAAPAAKRSRKDGDADAPRAGAAGGAGAGAATSAKADREAGQGHGQGQGRAKERREDFPTEVIAFGERTDRPPEIKVAPRKGRVSDGRLSGQAPR